MHKPIRRRRFMTSAAALGAVAAGAPFVQRARAQALQKIIVLEGTSPPDPSCHYYFYAKENGFYRDAGLDVEIKTITAETVALRALVAGEGDVAFCGAVSALQAAAAGARLNCVSAFASHLDYLVVGNKDVADLKHFTDRPFGITQLGAVSQIVPKLMIAQAGGDADKVKWVSAGNSAARVEGLVARALDGAALNGSFAARATHYDYLKIMGNAAEALPDFVYTWEISTAHVVATKKAALQSFVTATAKGARWGMANPDKAVAIGLQLLPDLPPEELTAAIKSYAAKKFWSTDGLLPRRTWDFTTKTLIAAGSIKDAPSYDDFVVREFSENAAKALGPFRS